MAGPSRGRTQAAIRRRVFYALRYFYHPLYLWSSITEMYAASLVDRAELKGNLQRLAEAKGILERTIARQEKLESRWLKLLLTTFVVYTFLVLNMFGFQVEASIVGVKITNTHRLREPLLVMLTVVGTITNLTQIHVGLLEEIARKLSAILLKDNIRSMLLPSIQGTPEAVAQIASFTSEQKNTNSALQFGKRIQTITALYFLTVFLMAMFVLLSMFIVQIVVIFDILKYPSFGIFVSVVVSVFVVFCDLFITLGFLVLSGMKTRHPNLVAIRELVRLQETDSEAYEKKFGAYTAQFVQRP